MIGKSLDIPMREGLPYVSVVVIGRNEGERLVSCLRSVQEVDYPSDRLELIYVDSDSADDSCAVAEKLGAKVVAIHPQRLCAAAARNAGLHAASHELIQFLDGDTILNASWLQKAVVALDDRCIACVFGRLEEKEPTATVYNFWTHHDWHVPPGRTDFSGGIALFRRDVVLKAGGYDESLIAGEERDLSFRLIRDHGATIVCVDEPMVLHDINMTRFTQYWWRCFRSGYAYAQVSARYSGLHRWRRICRRNMVHACAGLAVIILSLSLLSVWPMILWASLILVMVLRDALRCRKRVGSTGGALLYAAHHYLSKVPAVCGQLEYYFRDFTGVPPRRLVEHRREGNGAATDGAQRPTA